MKPAWFSVVLLAACGGGAGGGDTPDGPPGGDDAPPISAKCDPADGWQPLIQRSWSLSPGQETYRCRHVQVPADQYITGYCSDGPVGTHHSVLTISNTAPPPDKMGDYDCMAGSLDSQMLYAAGLQTDDVMFPTGVAMKLAGQQYINLNLHLFNTSDAPLSGTSGIYIKTVPAAAVVHEADMVFSGTYSINIPPDGASHDAIGGCTAPADWHVFGVWPHMHQVATHQKLEVTPSGAAQAIALLDDAYDFNEQKNYPMAETLIHQGDSIRTTCTYVNNTGATVRWGDSSSAEMCFTGMYKWPAGGGLFACTSQ